MAIANLTEQELQSLKDTTSQSEWTAAQDAIKAKRKGQYPPDWFAKVVLSGLLTERSMAWVM